MDVKIVKKLIEFSILFSIVLFACLPITSAALLDNGPYWNKFVNDDGSYNLRIYNTVINYFNASQYTPINYGSCGSNCFKDWNGLIYRTSTDAKKAYIGLYDVNDNLISSFGFGITGDIGGTNYQYSTLNFTWTWAQENNPSTNEYIFRAYNNNVNFNWTQEYHFYPNQSMKIKNTITNELGVNIQNTKFWYTQTINEGEGIWLNGTKYAQDTYKTGEFDSLLPKVKFEDYYVFEYDDLLENGFNITDFYLGDGDVIGVGGIRILAIGITKGNSVFPSGYSVTVDPTVKITSSEGGDAYVSKGNPNRNYGDVDELKVQRVAWQRAYLKFNISSIPSNQVIDNASLCLYLFNDQGSQTISANHVYDNSWCEGDGGTDGSPACEITWNNQPCGIETESLDSNSCNTTAESSLFNDAAQDETWQCWNVANMVGQEYNSNNESISIILWTIDDGNADIFYSKEYSNSSLWPYLNITYHTANNIPLVSSISLTPLSPTTTNDLTCSFKITDSDAGDSLTANITWYKNTAIYSSTSQPVTNGTQTSSILDSSNTAKSEEWNCTIIPYDGTAYGTQDSNKVTIQNSPPTAPNISITPSSPITTNDLNVVFNAVSQDNDSDSITYSYQWYKDGILQPAITGSTVSSGVTSKNQVWKVIVTPNDGEEDGTTTTTNVTIQNSLPSITSASITPTTAYETTTLTLSIEGWSDLDGESENYIYQWFNQNGAITGATSQTLTGTDFNKNDQIHCNITPYDSDGYGTSKPTNTVTIQNSPPILTVSIASELRFNGTDEDLIGSFTVSDADSDIITNNQTKWYKDSIEQTDLADLTTISYTNTSAGDVWTFSVRANDGETWSNWYNSSITILDISQTYPVLVSPANGTYFNISNVVLTYTTPNYLNMNCTIFSDTNSNPTTSIKTNTNLQGKTTLIYNWQSIADNTYYWKAGCTNNAILLNSTIKAFIVDTTYPTTAPTLTQLGVSDSDNDGNIELSWTADPDANTYNIYRSSTQITDATNLTKIDSTSSTSWEDNTTLHNNVYWYALTTVDAAGNENKSIVSDSFNTTPNDLIKPRLPNNVNASSLNSITTIYWTKVVQDIDGNSDQLGLQYKLWYKQNSTVNFSKTLVNETADYIKTVTQDSCLGTLCQTTHTLSGSTQYYYFITTIDDANNENLTLSDNYTNLTATIAPPGEDGGGGGGGGGGGTITIPTQKDKCKEDWSCSGWYSCVNDIQARTCVDVNACGTGNNKPKETRPCGSCEEKWQCGDWTPCVNNKQTKVCIDKNDCGTETSKPEEEQDCNLDTCSDGIKNYGEVGIDCGGPCKACKASDFITGGAIALKSTKGPNRILLIPTIILLVLFLIVRSIRKSDMKFRKIISALHLPMILIILSLFILSFFGAKISQFTAENKTVDQTPLDPTLETTPDTITKVTGLNSDVEFNPRKAKITSAIFLIILSLTMIGLILKKKFPDKLKFRLFRKEKKIEEPTKLTKEQIDEIEKDIEKSEKEHPLVGDLLEELDKEIKTEKEKQLYKTKETKLEETEEELPIKEIKDMEIEVSPQKLAEQKSKEEPKKIEPIIKSSPKEEPFETIKEPNKQEILNQIKEAYQLDKIEK